MKYHTDLTEKEKEYLTMLNNWSSNVYGLPNIHKRKITSHAKKKNHLKVVKREAK